MDETFTLRNTKGGGGRVKKTTSKTCQENLVTHKKNIYIWSNKKLELQQQRCFENNYPEATAITPDLFILLFIFHLQQHRSKKLFNILSIYKYIYVYLYTHTFPLLKIRCNQTLVFKKASIYIYCLNYNNTYHSKHQISPI